MVHKTGVHACPECSKTFTRLEYVNRHRRLKHLGLRPWSCPCGVSYARSDLLCRHKRKCPQATSQATNPISVSQQPSNLPIQIPPGPHSSFEVSGQPESFNDDMYGGALPPSYGQAIGYNPLPARYDAWGQLPMPSAKLPGDDHRFSSQDKFEFSTQLNESNTLPSVNQSSSTSTDDQSQSEFNHQIISSETYQDKEEHTPSSVSEIGHPDSYVVRYSDPQFFITEEEKSSKYYLNPSLWTIAFMCQKGQGFTIPTVGTLSKYLRKATYDMLPLIPMIHVPTFKASIMSIHLGYALTVAGAATDSSEHAIAFANQSLLYKRPLVQRDFILESNPFDFRFELLQTLLTYQFLGIFNRLDHQRQRAVLFNDTLVENFKNLALTRIVQEAPDYVKLVLEGHMPLELAWRSWAKYETHKRTVFLVLMSAYQLSETPGLNIQDANIPLPCHEEAWTAPDPESWLIAMYKHTSQCRPDQIPSIGEASIPLLTDALAALDLGSNSSTDLISSNNETTLELEGIPRGVPTLASPTMESMLCPSPVTRAGQLTSPPELRRLGTFANLVLGHCRKMNLQNDQFINNDLRIQG
ncbi:uncharacterized protein MELLADRAFT_87021 [Melampsora larici-populina 98AG31]|uniref:C2H2-type domain-containing protein n=1 Tax=Melampsora larici-populina (strain 98AG31 / pathotype 3-4-7) TaxID=747676 RepID=F4R484_MELLP|nr:uncharacterized protein MELLADRAFT_87021 [Melampsora larici-populina 98AG31]EGG12762.1 hypothetical protein MELLADRAFT_87021 [Melampsora larici-populina 98AG31]